jgi:hypothetical protein
VENIYISTVEGSDKRVPARSRLPGKALLLFGESQGEDRTPRVEGARG